MTTLGPDVRGPDTAVAELTDDLVGVFEAEEEGVVDICGFLSFLVMLKQ